MYGVFKYLKNKHNINANFSSTNCGYITAYRYVCKDKTTQVCYIVQVNLPKRGSQRTKNAIKQFSINHEKHRSAVAKKASDSETSVKKAKVRKPKRLSNKDVSEFLLKHSIKTENELMGIAKQRHGVGEKGIYNFIVNKTQKALNELVSTTWKIQNATAVVKRNPKSRIKILNEYANTTCVEN